MISTANALSHAGLDTGSGFNFFASNGYISIEGKSNDSVRLRKFSQLRYGLKACTELSKEMQKPCSRAHTVADMMGRRPLFYWGQTLRRLSRATVDALERAARTIPQAGAVG